MPYTVFMSFQQFQAQQVDLDPGDVETARKSRDYLHDQIKTIAYNDSSFPRLYGGYKAYGSFARKTKVRPLDDIDMLVLLDGKNTSTDFSIGYTYKLHVNDINSPLWPYTDTSGYLNSTRLLNKFKSSLGLVPNYQKAEIKRNQVAVVLNLKSYDWVFDVVPAFPVGNGTDETVYYLIPNGSGEWMRTDPRKDQTLISEVNKHHNNNFIPLIRLLKYWNVRSYSTPRLSSYYFETMLINGLRYQSPIKNIRANIPLAFQQLSYQVLSTCPDPKGLGPNLDSNVDWDTKTKVRDAALKMQQYANRALEYEQSDNHKDAIMWWGYIFPNFPAYGS